MAVEVAKLIATLGADIGDFERDMHKADGILQGVAGTMKAALIGGTVAAGAAVAGFAANSVRDAIGVESAFAGVIKTTDGLVDEAGQLNEAGLELKQGFMELSTLVPVSPEAAMGVGELAGQLGIGREHLLSFTKTMADLGVTTNLAGEEAAMTLARLANIMGTEQGEIQRYGSALVELGNNYATTERDIAGFAERIAGAGAVVGMSESDILAIGAALSSVGVEAEAGGTAVQRMMLEMQEAVTRGPAPDEGTDTLKIFAQTAGMTAEEFQRAWREDAGGAFTAFVEGLGEQGDRAMNTLGMLELGDARLIRSFLGLAQAQGLLGRTMESSRQAWDENTALAYEASLRYGTTESQLQILANTFKDLSVSIGEIFLPEFNKLVGAAATFLREHGPGLRQTFASIISGIKSFAGWVGEISTSEDPLGELWTKLTESVDTQAWGEWLGSRFSDVLDAAGTWIQGQGTEVAQTLITALQGLLSQAFAALTEGQEEDATLGSLLGEKLGDIYQEAVDWMVENAAPLAADLWDAYTDLLGKVVDLFAENAEDWGTSYGEMFGTILRKAIGALVTLIPELAELLWDAIQGLSDAATSEENQMTIVDAMLAFLGAALTGFITGLTGDPQWKEKMETWFYDLIVAPVEAIDLLTPARDMIQDIMDGFDEKMEDLKAKIDSIAYAITHPLDAIDLKSAGQDIIEGLKEGIWERAAQLPGWMQKVLGIEDDIKEYFAVGSPSQVFADIGQSLMEGFQLGIERASWRPAEAVRKAGDNVVHNYNLTATYGDRQMPDRLEGLLAQLVRELRGRGYSAPLPDVGMP